MSPAPSLRHYGLISDCHGAALVSRAGGIDWCCVPRFDSGSCFARLLDWPRGGHWSLTPRRSTVEATMGYVERTNVLETTLKARGAEARVYDFFAIGEERQLVRIVEGVRGTVLLDTEMCVRFDYGAVRPWLRRDGDGLFRVIGGDDGLVVAADAPLEVRRDHDLAGEIAVRAGERVRLVATYGDPHRLEEPIAGPLPSELDERLESTIAWWRDWAGQVHPEHRDHRVVRSALTLRALVYEPTGAIIAAPTTSLPEAPRGVRNWDYRYSWARDSTFSVRALATLGCETEPDRFGRFIMRSAAGHAADMQVAYGVGGERRIDASELPLRGYRGARPVRVGNGAIRQVQHDEVGEIIGLAWRRAQQGRPPDDDEWRFLATIADMAARVWREPDRGFWEYPGEPRRFVHSTAACWSALHRARELAAAMRRRAPARWRREQDAAFEAVLEEGYDEGRGTFVQAFGHRALDATSLLLPVTGIIAWDDPRMVSTTDVLRERLGDRGFLRRYDGDDGLPGREGAFLACSFWLVECLARQGRAREAHQVYERALEAATPLGLFSEELNARSGEPLGNFPQGLTHLAHIAAALSMRDGG